ncbi:tRNA synthetases class II-domain-containing protein [Paraphysoderma sedebokerense]|nr:tRNA synthetases class II-domain-containing protein [Paraphysoderma sedebokerense]
MKQLRYFICTTCRLLSGQNKVRQLHPFVKDWPHPTGFRSFSTTPEKWVWNQKRTHSCAELNASHVGQKVILCGWAEPVRKLSSDFLFIPLRDRNGVTQLVIRDRSKEELLKKANELTPESIICATGSVVKRPVEGQRLDLSTGEIEVEIEKLQILNKADHLPYRVFKDSIPNEDIRLQYRFLDLRRPSLQKNIRLRSEAVHLIRSYLHDLKFLEIETPTLFKSTPEGAREFLVPTRKSGRFYALPQSPQQYKQLLMSAGMDRYFQLAKCFRDEDLRADRQPEFTQVDMELSFTSVEEIRSIIEGLIKQLYLTILNQNIGYSEGFPVMTYNEAMNRYGSDKPDLRYGLEINDITAFLEGVSAETSFEVLVIPGGSLHFSNSSMKRIEKIGKDEIHKRSKRGSSNFNQDITVVKVPPGDFSEWLPRLSIFQGLTFKDDCPFNLYVQSGDIIIIGRRQRQHTGGSTVMGNIRTHIANQLKQNGTLHFAKEPKLVWIDTFPLFTPSNAEEDLPEHVLGQGKSTSVSQSWISTHHPFTAPFEDDYELLKLDPGSARGLHYDLVLNGCEVAGGSIRIHQADLQMFVFESILKMSPDQISRFKHLIDALRFGCPPHGGIAIGNIVSPLPSRFSTG